WFPSLPRFSLTPLYHRYLGFCPTSFPLMVRQATAGASPVSPSFGYKVIGNSLMHLVIFRGSLLSFDPLPLGTLFWCFIGLFFSLAINLAFLLVKLPIFIRGFPF